MSEIPYKFPLVILQYLNQESPPVEKLKCVFDK